MLKNLLSTSAAVALLVPLSLSVPANAKNSGVQLAQMQIQVASMRSHHRSSDEGGNERMREIMNNQDRCNSMMDQFDAAKTTNAKAIKLRKKAEVDCGGASPAWTGRGVDEMKDALKMIGIKPSYDW